MNLPDAPIAINIKSNDNDLDFINLDLYQLKILDYLNDFQEVHLTRADENEKPEIIFNLTIDNFNVWPRNEQRFRQNFSRVIAVGKDANGKTLYQTITASADVVQTEIRANATFKTSLSFTDGQKPFNKVFPANYRYKNAYVENITGDARAISPRLLSSVGPAFEPEPYDLLLALSRQEMVDRISRQIRSYYSK